MGPRLSKGFKYAMRVLTTTFKKTINKRDVGKCWVFFVKLQDCNDVIYDVEYCSPSEQNLDFIPGKDACFEVLFENQFTDEIILAQPDATVSVVGKTPGNAINSMDDISSGKIYTNKEFPSTSHTETSKLTPAITDNCNNAVDAMGMAMNIYTILLQQDKIDTPKEDGLFHVFSWADQIHNKIRSMQNKTFELPF